MGKWKPCKRRDFIKKLKKLGFGSPEPGGRHFYMRHGTYTLPLPNNKEIKYLSPFFLLKNQFMNIPL
jgi:hypothetical protein